MAKQGGVSSVAGGSGGRAERWQEDERLFDDEKWVLGGAQGELWPFKRDSGVEGAGRIYLFPSYNTSESVHSRVPAGALLARAMGAVLQERLQDNTTHVLVDELLHYESLKWNAVKHDKSLLEAYKGTDWWAALSDLDENLTLVTVPWLSERWTGAEGAEGVEGAVGVGVEEKHKGVDDMTIDEIVIAGTADVKVKQEDGAGSSKEDRKPLGLIMCGFPGSGKSTFAAKLVAKLDKTKEKKFKFIIIRQDDLKTLEKCKIVAQRAVEKNLNVLIDRTNIDVANRKLWRDFFHANSYETLTVFVNTPVAVCEERCRVRTDHKTIGPGDEGRVIISGMQKTYKEPDVEEEGGDESALIFVDGARVPREEYGVEEIGKILGKLGSRGGNN